MFKPLSQLNYFFRLATERKLSGSDQLMYLHIFNKFNQAHWTETLRIKDAELKELMRLYDSNGSPASIDIIRRGRQRLKAKGFIEFKSGDGYEPEYRLPCLHPTDTPADTPADTQHNSYIRVREDEEDVKTKNSAATCERVGLEEILEEWENNHGRPLSIEEQSQMQAWAQRYGEEWLKGLFPKAWEKCTARAMCFAYIKGYISREVKGGISPKTKGGEENGGYKLPKRTGGEEWAKY